MYNGGEIVNNIWGHYKVILLSVTGNKRCEYTAAGVRMGSDLNCATTRGRIHIRTNK